MKISYERPPMFDVIDRVFHVAGKPIIFAWGDTIFNPMRIDITRELHAHEEVHGDRQGPDIVAWWERYIIEPSFRLAEELPAHHAEYRAFCKRHGGATQQRAYLTDVADRLASSLYGGIITRAAARNAVLTGRL